MCYTDSLVDCSYHEPQSTVLVDNTTSSTTESLQVHGSPQLGYYVQLGLGTPYQVVSVFVMLININSSQSNYSTDSWWTLVAVTLSLLE